MRIDFESSGGYAGLRLTYHCDSDALPGDVAEEVLSLVESSGMRHLEQSDIAPAKAGPPDVLSYRLTLHEEGRSRSLSVNDITAPPEMRPLLALLRKLALERSGRRS